MVLVAVLISIGVGLVGAGIWYRLFDDAINTYFQGYILDSPYYQLADLVWDSIPYLLIIIGVLCLVLAGVAYKGTREVVYK